MTGTHRKATGIGRSVIMAAISASLIVSARAQETGPAERRASALALEQKGNDQEAEKIWQQILGADSGNAEALAHLGLLAARQNRFEPAIEYYRKALAIDPSLPSLEFNLGLALFKAGQFPGAIQAFSIEIGKHPGEQRLIILLGMAHYGMKDYLVAVPYFERASEQDPKNPVLLTTLAESCMWSKQYACVVEARKKMAALGADNPEIDLLGAAAFQGMGQIGPALLMLEEAVKANPKDKNLHFGLGYLLWSEKRWSDAGAEFQWVVENDSGQTRGRMYLADCRLREGKSQPNLADLEQLANSDPSKELARLDLGIGYAESGRTDDAVRELKLAVRLAPQDPEPHRRLAKIYDSEGRATEAQAELDDARAGSDSLIPLSEMIETPTP